MSSKIKHQKQYEKNKKLLSTNTFDIDQTIYYDWMITIMFYCSLHLVEKYIGDKTGNHKMKHYQRNNYVNRDVSLKNIKDEYSVLYSESIRARYECAKITKEDVAFVKTMLQRIENELVNY